MSSTPAGPSRWAVLVYALSLVTLFAVSATYHRVSWREGPRRWMRRLDHSAIFRAHRRDLHAAELGLGGSRQAGARADPGRRGRGHDHPCCGRTRPRPSQRCSISRWAGAACCSRRRSGRPLRPVGLGLLVAGGVLYSVGALAYVLRRPNPVPGVFGYHEVFHALVVLAAALHFALVARASLDPLVKERPQRHRRGDLLTSDVDLQRPSRYHASSTARPPPSTIASPTAAPSVCP